MEPICYLLKKRCGFTQFWRDVTHGLSEWTHDAVTASQFDTWAKAEEKKAVLDGGGALVMIVTRDSTKNLRLSPRSQRVPVRNRRH